TPSTAAPTTTSPIISMEGWEPTPPWFNPEMPSTASRSASDRAEAARPPLAVSPSTLAISSALATARSGRDGHVPSRLLLVKARVVPRDPPHLPPDCPAVGAGR